MKNALLLTFLLLAGWLATQPCSGQEPAATVRHRKETRDGNTYTGIITAQDSLQVTLQTENLGSITLRQNDIVRSTMTEKSRLVNGEYWFENPQATRYFWAPNGYGLKQGESYYQNVWVMFNQFVWGISNHFSLGGGVVPLFLIQGTSSPVWITPKFSFPLKENRLNLGAGALIGTVLGAENTDFGLIYGTSTFGPPDKNISVGMAWGYAGGEWSDLPVFNLSGMCRLSSRTYMLAESYVVFSDGEAYGGLIAGGRRIIGRFGLDYGLVFPFSTDFEGFIAYPWLGFSAPFGK